MSSGRRYCPRTLRPLPDSHRPHTTGRRQSATCPSSVTGIAKARQRAAPSLDPRRGEVIENERPLFEMAAGEPGLDRGLACAEPVEGAVELDFVDRAEPEQPAQARAGGVGGEIARGC